jgi:activator of HSP90 ATPase
LDSLDYSKSRNVNMADQSPLRLITIYDCRIALIWKAEGADDTTVRGTVVIPEVSHENTLDSVSDYTVCLPV